MKALQAAILGLGLAAGGALAQATSDTAAPKAAADAKKVEPAKKPEPVKKPEAAKKPGAPKKPEPAKKPEAAKKPEPAKQSELPKSTDPNVRYFRAGDKDAPKLRDKDGNVIPMSPDAYDVSSALKK
jgi:outer membrane biosynthesis protein TonB